MFSGFSADQVAAGCGVITIGGGAAFTLVGLWMKAIERAHKLELDALRKDIREGGSSLSKAWEKIDKIKETAWTRDEHEKFRHEMTEADHSLRAELKTEIKELGDRLERTIKETVGGLREQFNREKD